MSADTKPLITGAVEGDIDEALLRKVADFAGLTLGVVHGRKGKDFLLAALAGYNKAAQFHPWAVLVDLDRSCDCAPTCAQRWLPKASEQMCFRIAVRAVESWLLADRERMARWLAVPVGRLPRNPDELDDPKQALINLARRSRRRSTQEEIVPRLGSGRAVGPLYATRMIEFLQDRKAGWRPDRAQRASDSLARCITRLRALA